MPCGKYPESVSIEDVLVKKTKSRKSHKNSQCKSECNTNDCVVDCCSPAYLRLDKLRTLWSVMFATGQEMDVSGNAIYNRGGSVVESPPTDEDFTNPVPFGSAPSAASLIAQNNDLAAFLAYYWVNVERYLPFESCGKLDQVLGWVVDTQSGDLQMLQNLNELNLTSGQNASSRANMLTYNEDSMTSTIKNQLANINVFYKLSLRAIEKIGQNTKTEGNICEVTDKCGNKWLILLNRATAGTSGADVCEYNSKFVIVAVPLC